MSSTTDYEADQPSDILSRSLVTGSLGDGGSGRVSDDRRELVWDGGNWSVAPSAGDVVILPTGVTVIVPRCGTSAEYSSFKLTLTGGGRRRPNPTRDEAPNCALPSVSAP
jgi:hypothetical protein